MAKVGKKYAEAAKLVDRSKAYTIEEAVALAKQTSTVKFDASVEVSFRLNVDPRHADQQIRGAMSCQTVQVNHRRFVLLHRVRKSRKQKMLVLIMSAAANCWIRSLKDGLISTLS